MARPCLPIAFPLRLPILLSAAFLASAALSSPALAQRFWPDVVDTVRVAARRPSPQARMARGSGSATLIPLGRDAPAERDLGDLLDRVAGTHVHRYGGLGAFSLASIRGSSPGQVLVCLDGVPVAAAGDGLVNLALLPAASLDHAEVYRGPQTLSFGGPPSAGVINLVTPGTLPSPLRLAVGAGSFGTATARGQWGGAAGPAGLFLSGQYRRSRGDFPYLDRNGTFFGNTADDRTVRRSNNDFEDAALLWKAGWGTPGPASLPGKRRSGVRLDYTGERFTRDGGVPGTESNQTLHVRSRTGRMRHEVALKASMEGGAELELTAHEEQVRDRFDNRWGEVGLGTASTDDRTRVLGGRAAVLLDWLSGVIPARDKEQSLRLGLDLREERWTPRDLLHEQTGFTRTRRQRTVFVEDRLRIRRIGLEAAYRWARAADNFAGSVAWNQAPRPSPTRALRSDGGTLGVRVDLGDGFVLKANRGDMARFPSFTELFGENGIQDGNPALSPESGVQWDAGLSCAPAMPLRLEISWFESRVRDRITWIQNSQRTTKAENIDRARIRGAESSLYGELALPRRVRMELQASATLQSAREAGPSAAYRGKELPNLPRREAFLSLRLARAPWGFRWEASARSSAFRDRYNSEEKRTPAHVVQDLLAERSLAGERWKLQAELRNVADVRVEDMDGFPLPGRTWMAEVTWTR